jgi:hypothetical protein
MTITASQNEKVNADEGRRVEFKTSAFYAPKEHNPGFRQMRTIAETVAAFMNADGGELFIGIADDGTIRGIDGDIAVLATMQSLASQAYTNGLHFVENLVNGINAGLPALRAAASEVASIMSEQVKHSVPKKGPMKDDDQWMRHYMQNLANGIKQNKGLVTDQMSTLAQDLASLGRPASSRAAASAGGFSRRMMSVNQNVTISNSYNGTAGGADRAIRNTMKKSAYDASTYMAKAIGYARG